MQRCLNLKLSRYLNYGSIGMLFGHELTHAFDRSCIYYDGNGLQNSVLTSQSQSEYDSRMECYAEQYSEFYIPQIDKYVSVKNLIQAK